MKGDCVGNCSKNRQLQPAVQDDVKTETDRHYGYFEFELESNWAKIDNCNRNLSNIFTGIGSLIGMSYSPITRYWIHNYTKQIVSSGNTVPARPL